MRVIDLYIVCVLQNPVITVVWVVCLVQLVVPAVMFRVECYLY